MLNFLSGVFDKQMKTKHTPGPWLTIGGNLVYALHKLDGRQVNRFSASICYYHSQGGTEEEGLANTLLIAAAPDLLCELINLRTQGGFRDLSHLEEVDALIAKATGEQP